MKLYVGNLPYNISDDQLQDMFAKFGTPDSARVITDRDTGQSKGFGFVEFSNDDQAKQALWTAWIGQRIKELGVTYAAGYDPAKLVASPSPSASVSPAG
jgi:hypothetical protein